MANGVQLCAIVGTIAYRRNIVRGRKIRFWRIDPRPGRSDIFMIEASKAEFEKIVLNAVSRGQKSIKTPNGRIPISVIKKLLCL